MKTDLNRGVEMKNICIEKDGKRIGTIHIEKFGNSFCLHIYNTEYKMVITSEKYCNVLNEFETHIFPEEE